MFISVSTGCVRDLPVDEACKLLTELEFDKYELQLTTESADFQPGVVLADPEAMLVKLHKASRLSPIAIDLDEDVPAEQFEQVNKLAKGLRIAQISLPSSPLGTPFNEEVDRLKDRVSRANQAGTRVSIRTEVGTLAQDAHTAVELCRAVKGLGLTLDPSHYLCNPLGEQPLEICYPFVYHVHLRDSSTADLQTQVGLGDIDFSAMIAALRKRQYRGGLSIDVNPSKIPPDARGLELRKLRMLVDSLL